MGDLLESRLLDRRVISQQHMGDHIYPGPVLISKASGLTTHWAPPPRRCVIVSKIGVYVITTVDE